VVFEVIAVSTLVTWVCELWLLGCWSIAVDHCSSIVGLVAEGHFELLRLGGLCKSVAVSSIVTHW